MSSLTWQDLRDAGRVVIDEPDRGLAIYPTTHGNVVIAVRAEDGALLHVQVRLNEMDDVANSLAESEARAVVVQQTLHEQQAEIAAYHLIQRAMGAA